MSILVEGKRLCLPGSTEPWPYWVGPDTAGRWHVTLVCAKPNDTVRTLTEAICGLKPPTLYIDPRKGRWYSWKYQQIEPPPGAACCADCLYAAQQHDWPRPAGLVALMTPSRARR